MRKGRGFAYINEQRSKIADPPAVIERLRELAVPPALGEAFSAKDFRTWNASVMAAVSLATDGRDAGSKTARKRAIDRAVRGVAELLGNTPAVARRAYIDPRDGSAGVPGVERVPAGEA